MSDYSFISTLEDLDAGIFSAKLSQALRDVALGTMEYGKKGKVVIELGLERIGDSSQVKMNHKLKVEKPTRRGKAMEEDTTTTPLYVARDGGLTVAPDAQIAIRFAHDSD